MNNLTKSNIPRIENEEQLIDTTAMTDEIVHRLKPGRESIGAYGESAGVDCPHCGFRQYPQKKAVEKCASCGNFYRVPEGYQPAARWRNEFLSRILRPAHRAAGLQLADKEHTLVLSHGDNRIAEFDAHATVDNILQQADQWLNQQKCGVSFAQEPGAEK